MKKIWVILLCALMLGGCSEPVRETVSDVYEQKDTEPCKQMMLELPGGVAAEAMDNGEGSSLYFGKDYWISAEIRTSGDLTTTLREATGYEPQQLQIFQTRQPDGTHYDCVFTTSGESGTQVGRLCLIDDGNYHYVLTAVIAEKMAGELQNGELSHMFDAFHVVDPDSIVSTGS